MPPACGGPPGGAPGLRQAAYGGGPDPLGPAGGTPVRVMSRRRQAR
ncbi:hypothetical protein KPATCC21470_1328 [Kitasatospora purpeofusca]